MEVYRIHIPKKHWPEPFYMQQPDNGKKKTQTTSPANSPCEPRYLAYYPVHKIQQHYCKYLLACSIRNLDGFLDATSPALQLQSTSQNRGGSGHNYSSTH